jgi:hypothetical protein
MHTGASTGNGRANARATAAASAAEVTHAANQRSRGGKLVTGEVVCLSSRERRQGPSPASCAFDVCTAGQEQGHEARGHYCESDVGLLQWKTPFAAAPPESAVVRRACASLRVVGGTAARDLAVCSPRTVVVSLCPKGARLSLRPTCPSRPSDGQERAERNKATRSGEKPWQISVVIRKTRGTNGPIAARCARKRRNLGLAVRCSCRAP